MHKKLIRFAFLSMLVILTTTGIRFYLYTHPHIYHIPSDKDTVDRIDFFALGDQGSGNYAQWRVARAMENVAEYEGSLDFVALMGDNFYHRDATTTDSSQWLLKFERVYSGTYLSTVPFYAVLGNHDHGQADAADRDQSHPAPVSKVPLDEVQLDYAKQHLGSNRWRMPGHHYSLDFGKVDGHPLLRMVFIDTGTQNGLSKEASFIRSQFQETTNSPIWKIVIGHHPVVTYGIRHPKTETDAMRTAVLPAMQESRVDMYLCGHDHNQQIIAKNGEPFYVISGGGGANTYKLIPQPPKDLIYSRSSHGFVHVKLDKKSFTIENYDQNGTKLAEYKIDRACSYGQASCLVAVKDSP